MQFHFSPSSLLYILYIFTHFQATTAPYELWMFMWNEDIYLAGPKMWKIALALVEQKNSETYGKKSR